MLNVLRVSRLYYRLVGLKSLEKYQNESNIMSKQFYSVAGDAWSQGQVHSKLWLLEELEPLAKSNPEIWILGGWYGMLAFMLFTRGNLQPRRVTSFDIDPEANKVAEMVNNSWAFDPILFTTKSADCTKLDFSSGKPDIIVNTSCEHFSSAWAQNLPKGILVAIQSTNMSHEEHLFKAESLEHFKSQYPILKKIFYSGQKDFRYPNLIFSRYMLIGMT
jgi:hypothetical protein